MITTVTQYRQAILDTQQVTLDQFPPFSLPRNSEGNIKIFSTQGALDRIGNSEAGFIGKNTAALVAKIL